MLNKNLFAEKLAGFLKEVYKEAFEDNILFTSKRIDYYRMKRYAKKIKLSYFEHIMSTLYNQSIMSYTTKKGFWYWNSKSIEPNLKMAEAIIKELDKKLHPPKVEVDYNAEALLLIRRALLLMQKKSSPTQPKDFFYSDGEGNVVTNKIAIIIR